MIRLFTTQLCLALFLSFDGDLSQIFTALFHVSLGRSLSGSAAIRRRSVFENGSGSVNPRRSSSVHRSRNAQGNQKDHNQKYLKKHMVKKKSNFDFQILTNRTLNQLATNQGCKVTVRTRISQVKYDSSVHETG